jgi:hypothetical protein
MCFIIMVLCVRFIICSLLSEIWVKSKYMYICNSTTEEHSKRKKRESDVNMSEDPFSLKTHTHTRLGQTAWESKRVVHCPPCPDWTTYIFTALNVLGKTWYGQKYLGTQRSPRPIFLRPFYLTGRQWVMATLESPAGQRVRGEWDP